MNSGERTSGSIERQPEPPLCVWYLMRMKPASRRSMFLAMRQVASITGHQSPYEVPWKELTPEAVSQIIQKAEERWEASTVKRIGVVLLAVCKDGMRRGHWTAEQFELLRDACRSYTQPTWTPSAGRSLTLEECRALLAVSADPRDRAILTLGLVLGLRRSELCGLNVGDLDPVKQTLRVKGKGSKVRYIPIPADVVSELANWCGTRPPYHPLFVTKYGGRLADRTVWQVIDRVRRLAGVDPFTPHDLRRTSITHMLAAGHDPILVARSVGHANPSTTAIYDRRGEDKTRVVFSEMRRKIGTGSTETESDR